jgi:Helix-turn-helix domain
VTSSDRSAPPPTELDSIQRDFGPLVDERTAADLLGAKVRTVQAWRRRGVGPPFVKLGSAPNAQIRYPLVLLREFLDRHLVATDSRSGPQQGRQEGDSTADRSKIADPEPTREETPT